MAEAARSVKHYVSDCLEERHPYDVQKGFAGRADRDRGRVFDGMLPGGLEQLVKNLSDEEVGDEERAKAVHYLYAHSSSQEMKITLLQLNVVTLIVAILRRRPFHLLEHQCFLLLRSLCTIPQGCAPVVDGGGVEVALLSMLDVTNAEERRDARTAATHLIYQIAFDFGGIRWMLRVEDCEELKLKTAVAEPSPMLMRTEDVMRGVVFVLATEPTTSKMCLHAVAALGQLTMIMHVLHHCAAEPGALDTVSRLLGMMCGAGEWRGAQALFLCQLLICVYNLAMDQACVEGLEERGVPDMLFALFARVGASGEKVLLYSVQRHLMGAISAVYKLTPTKLKSSEPLGSYPSRVMALVDYLEHINVIVDEAWSLKLEPPADVVAISKNTVQSLRLASEVRWVRDTMHRYIDSMEKAEPTRCFYFRRQLYYSTQWEDEYKAQT